MTRLIVLFVSAALSQVHSENNEYTTNDTRTSPCGQFTSPCKRSPYRSYDGSCNNLENPRWGSAGSAYERLFTKNSYSDGVHAWPRSHNKKKPLMNPRKISMMVSPDVIVKNPVWNMITLHWGQVIAHDMSLTAGLQGGSVPKCCTNGEPIPPKMNQRCMPIAIPHDDPFNAPEGNTCYDFVRTASNKDENCDVPGKVEEPLSAVTAFIDLSLTYGSTEAQARALRAGREGKLKFVVRNGQHWLPQSPTAPSTCSNIEGPQEPCYVAGDVRVNQNPPLALTQTTLMREHNRIAEQLLLLNPHWDDEKCFQESRQILIAMAQHITYHEFIQIYVGQQKVEEKGLDYPNAEGFVNGYNPKVNPQVLNEHATAAFRGPHSEIVGFIKRFGEDRNSTGDIRLSDWFNRPSIIEEYPAGMTRGLCTQLQNENDRFYDSEISNYLFRPKKAKLGSDLHAIDIQRARDHGIPPYIVALEECGFPKPKSFEDLEKYMLPRLVQLLKQIYRNLDDVELPVAGILETHESGALLGPTFACIVAEQMYRTRVGDWYFYAHGNIFTNNQFNSIKNATMSRLLCDNVPEVKAMQPNAFLKISKENALVSCHELPEVDLQYWKENSDKENSCRDRRKLLY